MPEISTEANEAAVSRVYGYVLAAQEEGRVVTPEQQRVYAIEHLMQEVNSGISHAQYFRWADVEEIDAVTSHLDSLGLDAVAEVTREAIAIAFPDSLPATDEEKGAVIDRWTEEQEEAMAALFDRLEDDNGKVMNVLGAYALRVGAVPAGA